MSELSATRYPLPVASRQPEPATGTWRPAAGAAGAETGGEAARLHQTAKALEGLFVEHLFKAMRETVPEGGVVDGGSGEEIFSGLLDSHLAGQVPGQWNHGLADALFRQLRGRVADTSGAAAPDAATPRSAETL